MFYRLFGRIAQLIAFVLNGKALYQNSDRLPLSKNYILVAPNRTWWDSIYLAIGASPKEFTFMVKEELFKIPVLRFILTRGNAFPVNRLDPKPSTIKIPIKILKSKTTSLMMFPTGSRYSTDLKGGVALIAKLTKVPIVPAVYQGPITFCQLLKRKPIIIRYGDSIDITDIKKMNKEGVTEVERRIQVAFDQLDEEINPYYKYVIS
ncbi:MAG: 1-acyl-sn-glycerol-3-phosphate acyltransferase [Enterococcus lacertideformus]|uniref:1-acyl-sn-glycerol-3-phosphate acyltransferase n=1 Tax=Enterococcus lacertideformus TaxID=2771493 RepID=A0A931FA22_9ENTE|nr:1-acyl-sn-glycerol-3-phosphate acyltransferase [Enterococcus lacertideformus]